MILLKTIINSVIMNRTLIWRKTAVWITTFALLAGSVLPSSAVDTSQSYAFEVSVNGEESAAVEPGENVKIEIFLSRTDDSGPMTIYAMSAVLRLNTNLMELEELTAGTGISSTVTERSGSLEGWSDVTLNYLAPSMSGVQWENGIRLITLNMKAVRYGSALIQVRRGSVSTYSGMDSFSSTLGNAVVSVQSAPVVKPLNTKELEDEIALVQNALKDNTAIILTDKEDADSLRPGEVWVLQSAVDTLEAAAANARQVVRDAADNKVTQAEIDQAVDSLSTAFTAFENAKIPVGKAEKEALIDALTEAQNLLSDTPVSTENGTDVDPANQWVDPQAADALDDAIKAAQDVAAKADATQAEVDAAKTALEKAVEAFNAAKKAGMKPGTPDQPSVDKSVLKDAIEAAQGTRSEAFASDDGSDVDPLGKWVPQDVAKALDDAIAAARAAADNPEAAQADVDAAKAALEKAVEAFNAAKKAGTKPEVGDGLDRLSLYKAIVDAQNEPEKTKISPDGSDVDPVDQWVPQGSANVLKRYLADALRTAEAAKTQPEMDEAASVLRDAIETFDAAKKDGTKSSDAPYRTITVADQEHGSVSAPQGAQAGQTVTINVKPDDGYAVDQVVVRDAGGNPIEVKDLGNGQYSYTQPESDVTLDVSLKETEPVGPGPEDHEAVCPSKAFSDLDTNLWYHEAIDYALDHHYFNGVSGGLFEPNGSMTRAMFVTVLGRIAGVEESQYRNTPFADVPAGQWYTAYVEWAAENGIVTGYDRETFGPDDFVTREQMAAILYRYAKFKGEDVASVDADRFLSFRDAGQVSEYARTPMIWAAAKGLINGMGDGTLAPQKTASRAEVAQLIMNFDKMIS